MIAKKREDLNLEKKRPMFFQLGLFIVAAGTLAAFTYRNPMTRIIPLDPIQGERLVQMEYQVQEAEPEVQEEVVEVVEQQTQQATVNEVLIDENTQTSSEVSSEVRSTSGADVPPGFSAGTINIPKPEVVMPDVIVGLPDVEAEYMTGLLEMKKFVVSKTNYPEDARELGVQGKVYVEFVVEKDGSLSNVKVLRKIYPSLDREAKRVVKDFPKWKPGEHRGEKVRTVVRLPITFTLN